MKRAVIIVAGGKGVRMGLSTPKQFLDIAGIPIFAALLGSFAASTPQ